MKFFISCISACASRHLRLGHPPDSIVLLLKMLLLLLLYFINVYYYGGAITKYAAASPYSVKSRNHKLAYTTRQQVRWWGRTCVLPKQNSLEFSYSCLFQPFYCRLTTTSLVLSNWIPPQHTSLYVIGHISISSLFASFQRCTFAAHVERASSVLQQSWICNKNLLRKEMFLLMLVLVSCLVCLSVTVNKITQKVVHECAWNF